MRFLFKHFFWGFISSCFNWVWVVNWLALANFSFGLTDLSLFFYFFYFLGGGDLISFVPLWFVVSDM